MPPLDAADLRTCAGRDRGLPERLERRGRVRALLDRAAHVGRRCLFPAAALLLTGCAESARDTAGEQAPARLRIEVGYAADVHDGPLTGRLFLGFSPSADPEPRIAAYNSARQRDGRVPFFAADVAGVSPGETDGHRRGGGRLSLRAPG